ncbi:polysaccharide pyruvyl transferase family protein [Isoptericola halotolerans]
MALLGQFGIGNLGNEASLDAMLDVLGDADLVVLTEEPGAVLEARGLPAVAFTDPGARRGGWRGVLGKVRDLRWAWRRVGEVDAIVVPGTGLLEGSAVRATAVPLTLGWYALAARCRRRPLHLLSVGVDDGGHRLTRALFGFVLRAATTVTVRDDGSAACAERLGRSRPPVVPDLVLAGQVQGSARSHGPWTVALGVIDTHGTGTIEADWDRARYLAAVAELVRRLVVAGARVRVVGGAVLDDLIADEVVARAGHDAVVRAPAADLAELDTWFAGCQVVVAARYHNLVTAVRAGVPPVSLGYARKQDWLLGDVGAPARAHDVAGFDPALVADQVLHLLSDGEAWQAAHADATAWVDQARRLLAGQASRLRVSLGLVPDDVPLEVRP